MIGSVIPLCQQAWCHAGMKKDGGEGSEVAGFRGEGLLDREGQQSAFLPGRIP